MTLKTRNRTLIVFICFFIICTIVSTTALLKQAFSPAFESIFGYKFFSLKGFSFIAPSDKTVILALIFLQFFIPITTILLFLNFEKTQSTLIILFGLFLLGCQLQCFRIFIGLFNFKFSFSMDYLVLGKLAIMGKLLVLASFFLIAAESRNSTKLNIEMDIFIAIIACFVITLSIPLRTAMPSKNFGIIPGYVTVLTILGIITGILTAITFLVSYKETEEKIILNLLVSYCIIMISFFILTNTDLLWAALLGSSGLALGTHLFMRSLHKMYLWS